METVSHVVSDILRLLERVEGERTKGARGVYYASAKPKLTGIIVPIEMLRRLRSAREANERGNVQQKLKPGLGQGGDE